MPKIAYFHKKLTKVVTFDTAPALTEVELPYNRAKVELSHSKEPSAPKIKKFIHIRI